MALLLIALVWCCAIITALVLSDEVYPWASGWELRSYVLDAAVPQGVDPAQHLEQMKKSCVEETVRRRLNSDICAGWDKLHDAALSVGPGREWEGRGK